MRVRLTLWQRAIAAVGLLAVGGVLAGLGALDTAGEAEATGTVPCAPPLYLGLDAYRHLDKLPYLELGDRTRSQSTADPGGSNKTVQTLPTYPDGRQALADDTGPGVMTFMRSQKAAGGPWQLSLDGRPPTTVTASDLGQTSPTSSPAKAIPYPLSLNDAETQGSGIVDAAIPFGQSFTWTSSGPHGNFNSIERRLAYGSPVSTWSPQTPVGDVAAQLDRARADTAPDGIPTQSGSLTLPPGRETTVASLSGGPSELRTFDLRVPTGEMVRAGNSRLRIYWDGESTPSVDAPLKFLVGDGAGVYQPQGRALVSGLLAGAKGDGSSMDFSLYYPMPFHSTARITLTSDPSASVLDNVGWRLGLQPFPDPAGWWGTLHVTYTSVPKPVPGEDMTFLDVAGSGRVVGTVINFSRVGGTLEGNPSFYIDDSRTPQVEGTGTEEWGLGGNYWNGNHQTTLPLGGLPSSTNNPPGTDVDGAAEYRFLVADSVPFNDHLTLRWQHGGRDETTEPYRAAVMWYGTSSQTAPLTDEVHVGDPPSAASHHYSSPGAVPSTLTAAYGYGLQAGATTDTGDTSTGTTSFTMRLDPANAGAFLRRMSDYSLPNQRSNVFVDGRFAGTWYAAGSFGGTDAQGVSRRWRDDEFPLPASLTAGKTAVSIQIQFVRTPADNAWSEFDYQMYSFVPPGGCATPTEPKPGPAQQLGIAAPAGHRGGHPAPGTAVLAAAAGLAFVSLVGLALLRKRSRAPGG